MNKGHFWFIVLAAALTAWIADSFRTALAKTAPLGYEDETGFHFGEPLED